MKILIIGGQGFIGYNLCLNMLKNNYDITVLEHNIKKNRMLKGINYIEKDFTKIDNYDFLKDVDIIYHLISTTNVNNSNNNIANDINDNLVSTIKLLDNCVKYKIKKIIFISSGGCVYGIQDKLPIKESYECNPICSYGIVKLTIEKYLELYNYLYNLDYVIFRLSNVYGLYHQSDNQGIINVVIDKINSNQDFIMYGDGSIKRDYIYVDDVIEVLIKAININSKHKIFNIGGGKSYSILEIINIIEDITNKKLNIIYKDKRIQDVDNNELDISLAKKELNWIPKTNVQDGIKKIVN